MRTTVFAVVFFVLAPGLFAQTGNEWRVNPATGRNEFHVPAIERRDDQPAAQRAVYRGQGGQAQRVAELPEPPQPREPREIPKLASLGEALEFIGKKPVNLSVGECGPVGNRPDPRLYWQQYRLWGYGGYPYYAGGYGYGNGNYSRAYPGPVYTERHPLDGLSGALKRELKREFWSRGLNLTEGTAEIRLRMCWVIEDEEIEQKSFAFIFVSDSQRRIVTATLDGWFEYDSGELLYPLQGRGQHNGLETADKSVGPYVKLRSRFEGPEQLARNMVAAMFTVPRESEIQLAGVETQTQDLEADVKSAKKIRELERKQGKLNRELAKLREQ